MKDVECARFYNERVPDGLAKMLPLPKKPYVSYFGCACTALYH